MIKNIAILIINNKILTKIFLKLFNFFLNNYSKNIALAQAINIKCKNNIDFSNIFFELIKTDEFKIFSKEIPYTIVKKEKGYGIDGDRFNYQQKYNDFKFNPSDKVLDIGSGHIPFATHLSDFFDKETTHRSEPLFKDDRPFTKCNIEDMPFKDKEFDFAFCSHVLEHVDNPQRACKELIRIAKNGYIETPTRTSDILYNFTHMQNHHKWHIIILNKTVIFMEWKDNERRDLKTNYFFQQVHSIWKNPFQDMMHDNRDMFVNMLNWESSFDYLVINKDGIIISNSKSE